MNGPALIALTGAAAYLVGAVPFGYLVARARGVDILRQGSGNIGATNVGRVLGKRFGLLVFALDFAKGAVPAAVGAAVGRSAQSLGPEALGVAAGLAAFLGHLFPIYLRFRGGKGVATGAGVVAVLLPGPALAALVTWVGVVCASRYVSLASLAAALILCVARLVGTAEPLGEGHRILTVFCLLALALVVLRHRANIARLLHGTENRIREGAGMSLLTRTVHVLALGLWFGSVVFFFLAAPGIFRAFESLADPGLRPAWLPLPPDLTREQGTRLAGVAIEPLFDLYFPLQGVCGFLAAMTALAWSRTGARRVHRVRAMVLILALATVLAGWPLARYVGHLRLERYVGDPAVAEAARAAFGSWHLASLLLNFVTLLLVTVGMALAAQLPTPVPPAGVNGPGDEPKAAGLTAAAAAPPAG